MPRCPGTVVVHRDQAMTCTSERCPAPPTPADWFDVHASVVPCTVAHREGNCAVCAYRPGGRRRGAPPAGQRRAAPLRAPTNDEWATIIPLGRPTGPRRP